ncbi:unnamed protein product [Orchesella dallaii]|uniref:CXXC-type zinc finger protein 1 n=1 Tax=Orchesella dallaii TaxID=48710 RepID=A0ABP1QDN7_9HEXA
MGRSKGRGGRSSSDKKPSTHRKTVDGSGSEEYSDWFEEHLEESKRAEKPSRESATVTKRKERDGNQNGKKLSQEEKDNLGFSEELRQCYWIHCVNAARPNSKYCSDDCGIKLAKHRILTLLPGRLEEWKRTPCVAEQKNKQELERAHREIKRLAGFLEELEKRRLSLDAFIEAVSRLDYRADLVVADDLPEEDGTLSCVSCGQETSRKSYLKHIERCYNKFELGMTFNSHAQTVVNGTPIHCDFLNEKTKRYCKRLKVLCPEHTKQPKHRHNAICGSPMSSDPYELDMKKICRLSKKQCNRHNFWEKLRQVEIDVQKVEAWIKLDTLKGEEQKSTEAMTSRGNLLGLLLHSTTYHDDVQIQMKNENLSKARDEVVNDRKMELTLSDLAPAGNNVREKNCY